MKNVGLSEDNKQLRLCVCVRARTSVTIITIYNIIYNMRHHVKVRVVAVAVSTASDVVEQKKGVSSMWTVFNDDY